MRKTVLQSHSGVELERIEENDRVWFRLSSQRTSSRVIEHENEAWDAFDLEVIARLSQPASHGVEAGDHPPQQDRPSE